MAAGNGYLIVIVYSLAYLIGTRHWMVDACQQVEHAVDSAARLQCCLRFILLLLTHRLHATWLRNRDTYAITLS